MSKQACTASAACASASTSGRWTPPTATRAPEGTFTPTAASAASPTAQRTVEMPGDANLTTPAAFTDAPPSMPSFEWQGTLVLPCAVLSGCALLGLMALRWKTRIAPKPPSTMVGWFDVYDRRSGESRAPIDLSRYPAGVALTLDPLRIEPLTSADNHVIAVQPDADGVTLVVEDQNWHHRLKDGDHLEILNRLEVEYRNPFAGG